MAERKVGLRTIADEAGVAISTVSHVLNGTATISEEVRRRVLTIASQSGYLAQRKAKGTIAVLQSVLLAVPETALTDSDVNLVSWTILNALTQDCQSRGIKVTPFPMSVGQDPGSLLEAAEFEDVSGIILLNDDRAELLSQIGASGIPVVLINGEDPDMSVDSVTPGNRFAAQKAAKWLLQSGHDRMIHISWDGRKTVQRRRDGVRDAFVEAHGRDTNCIFLTADGYEPHFGEAVLGAWLDRHPDRDDVTAVFCAADNLAIGAMRALSARGISVPEDMSVMGFDGVALGGLLNPPLTTIEIPLEQFGQEALRLLEQRVLSRGRARAAHRLELGCQIIERRSVAPRRPRMG